MNISDSDDRDTYINSLALSFHFQVRLAIFSFLQSFNSTNILSIG